MSKLSPLGEQFFKQGIVEDCPVYDFHGHMGVQYCMHFNFNDADATVRAMDRAGVRKMFFCHHASLMTPDVGNQPNIDAARKHPTRLKAYCGLNPNYPEIIKKDVDTFDDYADAYAGFKMLADYHGLPLTDDLYKPAWEMADDRGLLVLLHTWGGSGVDGYELVKAVGERYPGARIIVGHSIHGQWENAMALVRQFPRLHLELCAVVDERGPLEKLVNGIGSEKILYGTDFPWFDFHYYIGTILGADNLTDDDRHNILHRNAERLLMEAFGTID